MFERIRDAFPGDVVGHIGELSRHIVMSSAEPVADRESCARRSTHKLVKQSQTTGVGVRTIASEKVHELLNLKLCLVRATLDVPERLSCGRRIRRQRSAPGSRLHD